MARFDSAHRAQKRGPFRGLSAVQLRSPREQSCGLSEVEARITRQSFPGNHLRELNEAKTIHPCLDRCYPHEVPAAIRALSPTLLNPPHPQIA
jgi:hypothetical protein